MSVILRHPSGMAKLFGAAAAFRSQCHAPGRIPD
jgi:hypothetical protein